MYLTTLQIISGVEVDATRLMLMLKSIPHMDNKMAQLLPEISVLALAATELMEPLPDYESAARQNGWVAAEFTPGMVVKPMLGQPEALSAATWKQACEFDILDVPKFPCTSVFVVTPLLGAMLELVGERTDRSMFGWWMWADFREEQKRKYLLTTLGNYYENSPMWQNAANELVARHEAQEVQPEVA